MGESQYAIKISARVIYFVLFSDPMNAPAAVPPTVAPERSEVTWLEETRQLMLNRPARIKLKEIAEACDVSVSWLSYLQTDNLPDASIVKVQRVNKWLRENAVNVTV